MNKAWGQSDGMRGLEDLLGDLGWARGLAASLVSERSGAEDLVQGAYLDALQSPADAPLRSPRAWWGTVLRRGSARTRRGDERRRAREAAAVASVGKAAPRQDAIDPAELVDRAACQRELVDRVLALPAAEREAILLRWFEGQSPAAIAAAGGESLATVKSRLKRGLQRLREAFEGEHGADWRLALTPLAGELAASHGVAAAGSSASGQAAPLIAWSGRASKAVCTGAVALLGVGAAAVFLLSGSEEAKLEGRAGPAEASSERSGPPARPFTGSASGSTAAASPAAEALVSAPFSAEKPSELPEAAIPASVPPPGTAAGAPKAYAIDLRGRPLEGLWLRWPAGGEVVWQDGDDGWVRDATGTRFVPRDQREKMRRDALSLQRFLDDVAEPVEWRAALLNERIPAREVQTGPAGAWPKPPVGVEDPRAQPRCADLGRVRVGTLRTGSSAPRHLIARARPLRGRFVDAAGKPIRGAFVTPRLPEALAQTWTQLLPGSSVEALWTRGAKRSDRRGRFLSRRVPRVEGLVLRIEAGGFESQELRPLPGQEDLGTIVLERPEAQVEALAVRVLGPQGQGLAGAQVHCGSAIVKMDAAGRGRLLLSEASGGHAQASVVAEGFAPRLWPELAAALKASQAGPIEIRLTQAAIALQGKVLDPEGRPLAGALVFPVDGTPAARGFFPLEALAAGGWKRPPSAADGGFSLPGLAPREYRLRVLHAQRMIRYTFPPRRVDRGGLVLRLPPEAIGAPLELVVRPEAGFDVGGARLTIQVVAFEAPGGGQLIEEGPSLELTADGRARFETVPVEGGFLTIAPLRGPRRVWDLVEARSGVLEWPGLVPLAAPTQPAGAVRAYALVGEGERAIPLTAPEGGGAWMAPLQSRALSWRGPQGEVQRVPLRLVDDARLVAR